MWTPAQLEKLRLYTKVRKAARCKVSELAKKLKKKVDAVRKMLASVQQRALSKKAKAAAAKTKLKRKTSAIVRCAPVCASAAVEGGTKRKLRTSALKPCAPQLSHRSISRLAAPARKKLQQKTTAAWSSRQRALSRTGAIRYCAHNPTGIAFSQ